MPAVEVERIADDELYNRFAQGVFLKIFYYLCSRHSLEGRRENAQRVALSEAHPGTSVIYSDDSVHKPQI